MFKPDIVLINELKLDENRSNFFLRFEGYNTYDKPRNQFGGGVAIVIKSSISHTQTNEFDDLNLELVSIKINCKKFGDVQIVTYYNPPSSTLSLELFRRLSYSKLPFILGGDLKASAKMIGCSYDSPINGPILEKTLIELSVSLLNDRTPTRKNNILDLFLCSPSLACKMQNFHIDEFSGLDSDHNPVLIELNMEVFTSNENATPRLNLNKAYWDLYKETLCLSKIKNEPDINSLNDLICNNILQAVQESIPFLQKKTFTNAIPPTLLQQIKKKRILLRQYRKWNDPNILIEYHKIKNQNRKDIIELKWEMGKLSG